MRGLITLVVTIAVVIIVNFPAFSQQPSNAKRIGFLSPPGAPLLLDVFRKSLADLGHVEGQNITIDARWPDGDRLDRLPDVVGELIRLEADVIVSVGATAARAAKHATTDIPIIFEIVIDPVAFGLVSNVARPGGNITGFTSFDPQQAKSQLETLKEAMPGLSRIALLGDAGAAPTLFEANEAAANALGMQTVTLKVERVPNPDFESVFEAAKREAVGAVVVISTPVTTPHRKRIAEVAAKHRLPTMSPRDHADAGGILSFGTSFTETTRHTAAYVDKILKGAKPGDLPVETVRRYELIINLQAARELGIAIPPALLSRANQIIQ